LELATQADGLFMPFEVSSGKSLIGRRLGIIINRTTSPPKIQSNRMGGNLTTKTQKS